MKLPVAGDWRVFSKGYRHSFDVGRGARRKRDPLQLRINFDEPIRLQDRRARHGHRYASARNTATGAISLGHDVREWEYVRRCIAIGADLYY